MDVLPGSMYLELFFRFFFGPEPFEAPRFIRRDEGLNQESEEILRYAQDDMHCAPRNGTPPVQDGNFIFL